MMARIVFFNYFFLVLASCTHEIPKEPEESYRIISLLYKKFVRPISTEFPPPPPGDTSKIRYQDSLRIDTVIKNQISRYHNKRFIVAIDSNFKKFDRNIDLISCINYTDLLADFNYDRPQKKIEIDKISKKQNDSFIYFRKDLLETNSKDFFKFDVRISFTHIIFNKNYSKAAVIFSINQSKLAGATVLYFLEKIDEVWIIKCEEGLFIS